MAGGAQQQLVGLSFRFPLGRYHATPWGDHVNDGSVEWPPSPWRIYRALYATACTRVNARPQQEPLDRAIGKMASADPPLYQLPVSTSAHTRHYFPDRSFTTGGGGSTDKVIDAYKAVAPQDELSVWWNVALESDELNALAEVAPLIGYLGRSESICVAEVSTEDAPERVDAAPLASDSAPDDGELTDLLCPLPDDPVEALEISVGDMRKKRFLEPPGTRRETYAVRSREPEQTGPDLELTKPQVAYFSVVGGSRPAMFEAVAICQGVRRKLQGIYGRKSGNEASTVFSGKQKGAKRADDHKHAHYIALPDKDGRRVGAVVVWAVEGFNPKEIACIADVTQLSMRDSPEPLRFALAAIGRVDQLLLPDLVGPARRWRSQTPFALPRHTKRRGGVLVDTARQQLLKELDYRNLPVPDEVREIRGKWNSFRRTRIGARRQEAAGATGFELVFPEPISGPLTLGALSHFGLGLFVPAE